MHILAGQGADYSSARPERLLQLVDDDEKDINLEKSMMERLYECNMVVANLTLPSNLFHLLRRHTKTTFRKPLILLTPKAIMNDPDFFSTFEDLDVGTKFKHFIPDSETTPSLDVVAYMLCTGQVYYHLKRERNIRHLKGKVAIVRVEQLSPFPYKEFLEDFKKHYIHRSAESSGVGRVVTKGGSNVLLPILEAPSGGIRILSWRGRCL
ncbi:hypothetical protein AAG570_007001 [Ranatra chinensis]|uniref:2-oxoglutarate dehydrogenase E1 component/KDG C-terminal domain-containing protein n=1 Tax=Ranatra chinensis TaxID=642074 RepID=A0ABD0ZJ09_9HEMI